MVPDLQAALICEDVRLEQSGSNTLVGVLSLIPAPIIPFRVLKLCVFTRWVSGEGTFQQSTRILTPDDEEQEIARLETRFTIGEQDSHATNVTVFGGLEFRCPGDYPVEILLNHDLILRFPLRVVRIQNEPQR